MLSFPPGSTGPGADDPPPSMVEEVRFLQRHHFKFCSLIEIDEGQSGTELCVFRIAGKRQTNRILTMHLTKQGAYQVVNEEGGTGTLVGRVFESFEQVS